MMGPAIEAGHGYTGRAVVRAANVLERTPMTLGMSVSDEQLQVFLRQPIPRETPANIVNKCGLNSSGSYAHIASCAFLSLLFVLLALCVPIQRKQLRFNWTSHATIQGAIIETTRFSRGRTPLYQMQFSFTPPGSETLIGTCYRFREPLPPTQSVVVEYSPSDPSLCAIQGCHIDPNFAHTSGCLFMALLFPVFAVFSWYLRLRLMNILTRGSFTVGDIQFKRPAGKWATFVGKGPSLLVTYQANGKRFEVRVRASSQIRTLLENRLKEGGHTNVLFDPGHPQRAIFVDRCLV
jgi:hypothetical protein